MYEMEIDRKQNKEKQKIKCNMKHTHNKMGHL